MTDQAVEASAPHHHTGGAGRSPAAWALLIAVTVLGLASDLVSKDLAFRHIADRPVHIDRLEVIATLNNQQTSLGRLLPAHDPITVIPSVLDFTLVLNPGAVFGVGAGKRWLFVLFTVAAVGFSLWLFHAWTTRRDRTAHIGLGLLLAGGLGNLYDRLVFACVRDFIHPLPGVRLPFGLSWPNGSRDVWPYVSNIADLWLIIGIVILLIFSWRAPKHDDALSDDKKSVRDSDSRAAKNEPSQSPQPDPAPNQ